jgi:hypothetical protein
MAISFNELTKGLKKKETIIIDVTCKLFMHMKKDKQFFLSAVELALKD